MTAILHDCLMPDTDPLLIYVNHVLRGRPEGLRQWALGRPRTWCRQLVSVSDELQVYWHPASPRDRTVPVASSPWYLPATRKWNKWSTSFDESRIAGGGFFTGDHVLWHRPVCNISDGRPPAVAVITGPPTHSVGASIVLLVGVCRRRLSHCTAGQ